MNIITMRQPVCRAFCGARVQVSRLLLILFTAAVAASPFFVRAADATSPVDSELRERSIEVLREVFDGQQRWVKVHAAEYLLALDYPQGVQEAFLEELDSHKEDPQYQIGICRVLARATIDEREKSKWIDKIREACFAPQAPERLHATETLAKIHYQLRADEVALIEQAAQQEDSELAPYAVWVLLNSERPGAEDRLAALLQSSEDNVRSGAAFRYDKWTPKKDSKTCEE